MRVIDLTPAVRAGVLTEGERCALEGAVISHGGGAIELRRENLSDDHLEALDRYLRWADGQCSGQ